jgi:hypothetical protein
MIIIEERTHLVEEYLLRMVQTRFQLREDSKERLPRPRFHSSLQTVAYAVTDILRK